MKSQLITTTLLGLGLSAAPAVTLFQDNFNVPDNTSFDAAPTAGRLSGTLSSDTVLRAHRAQQQISNNQLLLIPGTAGVRFNRTDVPFAANTRFDWAGGAAGTAIIAGGGFTVSFDWTPDNNTGTEWIMWAVGTPNGDTGGSIVNAATTDYGILFRKNGGVQRFDNGGAPLGSDTTFPTSAGGTTAYPVTLNYSFADFNDGTNVSIIANVNGTEVANETFQWDGNAGAMHMEIATNVAGHRIDNLTVSTVPEPTSALLSSLALLGLLRRQRP